MVLYKFLPLVAILSLVCGHGRVMDPISRASAWRQGFATTPDYDDDGVNCGGYGKQYASNGGKCGICGDDYSFQTPRPHELGGTYGQGVIVAQFEPGSIISTTVQLTAYHRGFWEFKLCPDPENNEQECFDNYPLELEDGGTKYYPTQGSTSYTVTYNLPPGLVCEHCVLQWRYTAGNNWGDCGNGTQALGCGNQEQFGACSDITIGVSRNYEATNKVPEGYEEIPYPLFFYLTHGYFDNQQVLLNLLRKGLISPTQKQAPSKHKRKTHRQPRKKRGQKKRRKKHSPNKNKKIYYWK